VLIITVHIKNKQGKYFTVSPHVDLCTLHQYS